MCWKDLLDCNVDIYVSAFRIGVLQAVTTATNTTPSSCTHSSRTTQSSSRESCNAVATVASGESYQGKQISKLSSFDNIEIDFRQNGNRGFNFS